MNLEEKEPEAEQEEGKEGEEGKQKFSDDSMPLVRPKVPKQDNSYDCGVFVLEYAERFLKRLPAITRADLGNALKQWLNCDLFNPISDIDAKRWHIRRLVHDTKQVYQGMVQSKASASGSNQNGTDRADDDDDDDDVVAMSPSNKPSEGPRSSALFAATTTSSILSELVPEYSNVQTQPDHSQTSSAEPPTASVSAAAAAAAVASATASGKPSETMELEQQTTGDDDETEYEYEDQDQGESEEESEGGDESSSFANSSPAKPSDETMGWKEMDAGIQDI